MGDKIMTLHPDASKQGVSIDREKYDMVREAIIGALEKESPQTFRGLQAKVEAALTGRFEGSIGWYYTTVKLDLEARGEVKRVPGSKPQELQLA